MFQMGIIKDIIYAKPLASVVKEAPRHCVQLFWTPGAVPARLLCPWDFPGENTGVGCHSLLQGPVPACALRHPSPSLENRLLMRAQKYQGPSAPGWAPVTREPGRAPPRHAHGDLTSLAPHERLPEILVVLSRFSRVQLCVTS